MSWTDFNTAEEQNDYDLIPKGTLVKVRLTIKPGGYNDPAQGWNGGYATRSDTSGAVYLNCEFTVMEGPFARRKVWSLIGLYSAKGPDWGNMGRSFIKGILNSARGFGNNDSSPAAQAARRIAGLGDLEGLEFVARVDLEKDQNGQDKNVIKTAITPDHKGYAAVMRGAPASTATAAPAAAAPAAPTNRPTWAQ